MAWRFLLEVLGALVLDVALGRLALDSFVVAALGSDVILGALALEELVVVEDKVGALEELVVLGVFFGALDFLLGALALVGGEGVA